MSVKISQMPIKDELTGEEILPIVDLNENENYTVSIDNIRDYITGGVEVTYTNANPMPTALGGLGAGSTFDNSTIQEMFDRLLYPYQVPSFTGFSIAGTSNQEVGATIAGGVRNATWSTSNGVNINANSIRIIDVTNSNTVLAQDLPNTGSTSVTVPDLVKTSANSHTFRIEAINTNGNGFNRNFTVSWSWALHYGESALENLTSADVTSLRVKSLASNSNGTYNFQGGEFKYFCYPTTFGLKNTFKDTATNLDVAMVPAYTVNVTNVHGVTTAYYVHRTLNRLGGAITIAVSN